MPEQRTLRDLLSAQQRHERPAVHLAGGHAGGFAQRREEIDAGDRCIDDRPRPGDAGPADHQWLAYSAFVHVSLARAQRAVVGDGLRLLALIADAAVIGKEDDDGVGRLPGIVQRLQKLAHRIVRAFDHRAVDRIHVAGIARPILGDHLFARLQRDVDGEMRLVNEERLRLVGGDEARALVRQPLGERFAGLQRESGELERPEVFGRRARRVARDIRAEAAVGRQVALAAHVPFADRRGAVAFRRQRFGDGLILHRQKLVELRHQQFRGRKLLASGDPVGQVQARRILAGHDAGARRRAHRARRIGVGEADALLRELVKVRRVDESCCRKGRGRASPGRRSG